MGNSISLHLFLIAAVTGISRILFLSSPFGSETMSDRSIYLWLTKAFKEKKFLVNQRKFSSNLGPAYEAWQILPHFFISKLPEKLWIHALVTLNILSDVFLGIFIYLLLNKAYALAPDAAFLISLLILLNPLLLPVNARASSLGGRIFANLIFLTHFSIFLLPVGIVLKCVLASGVIFFTLNTSTFGSQAIVLISLMLSLLSRDIAYVIPVLVNLLLLPFNILGMKNYAICKIWHYKWYLQKAKSFSRISPKPFLNALKRKSLLNAIKNLLATNPLSILLFSLPCFFLIFRIEHVAEQPLHSLITLSAFILFALTCTYPGTIIGESERYLELSLPFIFIFFWEVYFKDHMFLLVPLLVWQIAIVMLNYISLNSKHLAFPKNIPMTGELEGLIEFLQSSPLKNIILVPTKSSYTLDFFLKDKTFLFFGFDLKEGYVSSYEYYSDGIYLIFDDLKVVEKMKAELIVFEKNYLPSYPNLNTTLKSVFENDKYKVLIHSN